MIPTMPLSSTQPAQAYTTNNLTYKHCFHSLPFQQCQALLTLFPKSFSHFPHGTCVLSVFNTHLASDDLYHQICTPLSKSATHWIQAVHRGLEVLNRILTHIDAQFQEAYSFASVGTASAGNNARPEIDPTYHSELFHAHSPLQKESYLVYFSLLTYMLKFSRFIDLTSCNVISYALEYQWIFITPGVQHNKI